MGLLAFVNVQTAQAQTKEETIAWIKEKIEKYGGSSVDYKGANNIAVEHCNISYAFSQKDFCSNKRNAFDSIKVFFPITSIKAIKEKNNVIILEFDANVVQEMLLKKTCKRRKYKYSKTIRKNIVLFMNNAESNLVERMEKALKHLATFCEQKEETF